jgi:hypothetical protein
VDVDVNTKLGRSWSSHFHPPISDVELRLKRLVITSS